ncbi:hypothetical protein L596_030307 [Steinernema carpocapsae]|uniref:IFT81 calponin homology domain-containing protein n=1 Tax=Steinernema carpocapsae TaxID=34508 RepID=A0A4U5LP22_STECR|nr:hypothetical protein L596_030307 [Steinernema carpocapsae]
MSLEMMKTIIDGLNAEPFNCGLDLVTLTALPNDKLLQYLSNVICAIDELSFIDIRREGPDETALRIFNALRVMRYKPPADIESLQEWRSQIVEGDPVALYPIFGYIFSNLEDVREKMYLARFLVRVDVPSELHSDSEIAELLSQCTVLMEDFKDVHQQASAVRAESEAVDDIMRDLKLMDEEKDQLKRKIDAIERKTAKLSNMDRHLALAALHRKEEERTEELQAQKEAGRKSEIIAEQQIQRLSTILQDLENSSKSMDFAGMMDTLREDIITDRYMVDEKMAKEISDSKVAIEDLQKIASIPVMDRRDIDELKREIENKNAELIQITQERDSREQKIDESLSIYRHQANAAQRKKAGLADQLQRAREELKSLTDSVERHRQQLIAKSGTDEFITSVQFKTYGERLRVKSNVFKRKNSEMDRLITEVQISEETRGLLQIKWNELQQDIQNRGGTITEDNEELVHAPERPKTAKPRNTDVEELKEMVREMQDTLSKDKTEVNEMTERLAELKDEVAQMQAQIADETEQQEAQRNDLLSAISESEAKVESVEHNLESGRKRIEDLEDEVEKLREWAEQLDEAPVLIGKLEVEIAEANHERQDLMDMEKRRPPRADARNQMVMWKSLETLFLKKLDLAKNKNRPYVHHEPFSEAPIGDIRPPPRVESALGHRS